MSRRAINDGLNLSALSCVMCCHCTFPIFNPQPFAQLLHVSRGVTLHFMAYFHLTFPSQTIHLISGSYSVFEKRLVFPLLCTRAEFGLLCVCHTLFLRVFQRLSNSSSQQGAQAHRGYLCQRSCSTMGDAEIDHLRVPAELFFKL